MHLWGLLALLEKHVGKANFSPFEEKDDFAFWDKYFKVQSSDAKSPYVDPLTRTRRIGTHPHSNVATARKQTFENSWAAGLSTVEGGTTKWKLANDYAKTFRQQAAVKAGVPSRIPVVDLGVWLFRGEEFPDDATAKTIEERFKERFPQEPADYDAVFEFRDEKPDQIFATSTPSDSDYAKAIEETLLASGGPPTPTTPATAPSEQDALAADNQVLLQVQELLAISSSGVILRGAPGTGKTWYAHQIAKRLVKDAKKHIFKVQFHPSYGYEDFVEGYRPSEKSKSGFEIIDKVFLDACEAAAKTDGYVVIIIDEINRGDPARVLGELLTYIERGYRGEEFHLPYSGKKASVPANLFVIGTMNPFDRSITELDMALVRRFDHVDLEPSSEAVASFLEASGGFTPQQINRVTKWFDDVQNIVTPQGVGHTYFKDAKRPEHLRAIWRHRILPYCESILELDETTRTNLVRSFEAMYADLVGQQGPGPEAVA
jgi:MoxR-like ATPase